MSAGCAASPAAPAHAPASASPGARPGPDGSPSRSPAMACAASRLRSPSSSRFLKLKFKNWLVGEKTAPSPPPPPPTAPPPPPVPPVLAPAAALKSSGAAPEPTRSRSSVPDERPELPAEEPLQLPACARAGKPWVRVPHGAPARPVDAALEHLQPPALACVIGRGLPGLGQSSVSLQLAPNQDTRIQTGPLSAA